MVREKIDRFLARLEWRASLANFIWSFWAVASAAVPAWAVRSMEIFSDYAPLSWVIAGFAGLLLYGIFVAMRGFGMSRAIKAQYDSRFLKETGAVDPLSKVFESKRIFLNNFVLPSNPVVSGKTFVDCEIVGPANIYLESDNNINDVIAQHVDAVALSGEREFLNGFIFRGCTFRGCTFIRVTLFFNPRDVWRIQHLEWLNWITPLPEQRELPISQPSLIEDQSRQSPRDTEA